MKITLTASDGTEFHGSDYTALVKLLEKHEEKLEAKKKEDAEQKESEEKSLKEVNDSVDLVNKAVEKYEKESGVKLNFVTVNGKLTAKKFGYIGEYAGMPIISFSTENTHDTWWNELNRILRNS